MAKESALIFDGDVKNGRLAAPVFFAFLQSRPYETILEVAPHLSGIVNMEKGKILIVKKLAASVVMLAGSVLLSDVHAQQSVLVSDGTTPPAGTQASGVTVNGSTISTGGINNVGNVSSNVSTGSPGTSTGFSSNVTQTSQYVGAGLDSDRSFSRSNLRADSASTLVAGFTSTSSMSLTDKSFSLTTESTSGHSTYTSISYSAGSADGIRLGVSGLHQPFLGMKIVNGNAIVTNDVVAGGDVVASGQVVAGEGVVANGRVENVADGVVATDAVNVRQLNEALGANGVITGQVRDLGRQVGANRSIASTGTAIAMAAASVPALEGDRRFGIGVGTGTYDGKAAISVAGAARLSRSVQVKLNLGTGSNGKTAAGAGALFSW